MLTQTTAPALLRTRLTFPASEKPVPTPPAPGVETIALAYIITSNWNEYVGQVIECYSRADSNIWYGNGWISTVAVIDPDMANGKCYRIFGIDNISIGVVQYWDEDNLGNRHNTLHPYNLIRNADGGDWPLRNDSVYSLNNGWHWVEVEVEGVSTPVDELSVDRQPEAPEANKFYNVRGAAGTGTFLAWYDGEVFLAQSLYRERYPLQEISEWTPAVADTPVQESSEEVVARLRNQINQQVEQWEKFNEVLNELADDHDFCGEYESVVTPLGLTGRHQDYNLEYEVTWTGTISSPSSYLDERISSEIGTSVETSSVQITGKSTVYIEHRGSSESDARDCVDSDDLASVLEDQLSGVEDIEVEDYDFQGSSLADD